MKQKSFLTTKAIFSDHSQPTDANNSSVKVMKPASLLKLQMESELEGFLKAPTRTLELDRNMILPNQKILAHQKILALS